MIWFNFFSHLLNIRFPFFLFLFLMEFMRNEVSVSWDSLRYLLIVFSFNIFFLFWTKRKKVSSRLHEQSLQLQQLQFSKANKTRTAPTTATTKKRRKKLPFKVIEKNFFFIFFIFNYLYTLFYIQYHRKTFRSDSISENSTSNILLKLCLP